MTLKSALRRLLRVQEASAHCDIPCGIYDPISAKIAAQTVLKMVMRIQGLDAGDDQAAYQNTLSRYITV
ncbi:MAG TPA: superoxide dismutase, Ni, partial [Dehalococcoidia bacterium]|nr:superoxide dismutase, Ni [Dehalococcoidia bacterium]